jgi:hypothetical protein
MTKLLGLLGIVFLFGCSTASHVVTGKIHPAISPDAVKIYQEIPPSAEIIGVVTGNGSAAFAGGQGSTDRAMAQLKKSAATIGANGLKIQQLSESENYLGQKTYQHVQADAFFVP